MKRNIYHLIWILVWASCLWSLSIFANEPKLVIDPHGHASTISDLMFIPDGTALVSVSHDKTIRVWDVETGDLISTLRGYRGDGHEGSLMAGALSPDGKVLAVGGFLGKPGGDPENTGQIRLFNLETGEQIETLKGHENVIFALAFSDDGTWLASGSGDRLTVIWDVSPLLETPGAEAAVVAILQGHAAPVSAVAFAPDKRTFVSASFDGTLRVRELRQNPQGIMGPDVLQSSYSMERHRGRVYCAAYAPNGEFIVSGGEDGQILLWDGDGKFVSAIDRLSHPVATVSFSADSQKIVASGFLGKETHLYAIPSGERLLAFAHHTNTVEASAWYGGNLVATAGGNDNDIYIWQAESGTIKTHIATRAKSNLAVAFGEDLNFAIGNVDLSPSDFEGVVPQHSPEYTPLVKSFNFTDMSLSLTPPELSKFTRVQTSYQDTELEWVANDELRIGDGETINNHRNYDGWIRSYTFTPQGDVVVGSSYSLKVYQRDGTLIRDFIGHTGEVLAVSMSADGRILASGSDDQTIKLWNLHTGECLATLFVASDNEWVCWTPQGYYAASAGGEKYVGWHLNQGMNTAALYYPVSVFRKQFHRPVVVKRTIAAGSFEQALQDISNESGETPELPEVTQVLPPTVRWITPEPQIETREPTVRIRANIESDSDLSLVKILINGRTQAAGRGLAMMDPDTSAGSVIDREIALVPGRNEIVIFAANAQSGTTSSKRTVLYRSEEHSPDLYVVAIGISEYLRSELRLEYADDDAKAVGQAFRGQESTLYRTIVLKELYDADATRGNIVETIEWLQEHTTQNDVAILFMAAHGANEEGKYFLLPADADPDDLVNTGVGWQTFSDILGNLPSKVLLFLDTCHSGQLGRDVQIAPRRVDNTEALRTLASDEYGVVILAASTGSEPSLEHPDWGHGAFTTALLEAIEQGLADYSEDGIIHLRELDLYVADRVEALTDGAQHPTTQKPSTISRFPVVRVSN